MPKKVVIWSPAAKADIRAIDRTSAYQILEAINDYLNTGVGDVIKLQPPRREFRLRVGDYRVLFFRTDVVSIEVIRIRHRSQAYR